jgi:hypothetical protein
MIAPSLPHPAHALHLTTMRPNHQEIVIFLLILLDYISIILYNYCCDVDPQCKLSEEFFLLYRHGRDRRDPQQERPGAVA